MADTKISALAAAAALGGTEALPAVQAAGNVRVTPAQLAAYILASAALTGTPTAPTAAAGDSSTRVATTGFVATALAALVNAAPGALDTLKELADAIGDDANYAATVTSALAGKQAGNATLTALASLASGANLVPYFTGAGAMGTFAYLKNNVTATDPGATADSAAGYVVGSTWLNSTSGIRWICLDATAGAATWAPTGYTDHPGYVSGRTYPAPSSGRSAYTVAADTLYACRIDIKQRVTVSALAAQVSTAATGNMRLGLYANSGGGPGAKLAEAASPPSTGTGGAISSALAANLIVNPGVYWLACLFSAAPGVYAIAYTDTSQAEFIGSASVGNALSTAGGVTGLTGSGATYAGGLPASFGSATTRYALATPLLGIVVA